MLRKCKRLFALCVCVRVFMKITEELERWKVLSVQQLFKLVDVRLLKILGRAERRGIVACREK